MEATQKRGNVWASIFLSLLETILVTSEIKYFLFPKKHSQNILQHAYERQHTNGGLNFVLTNIHCLAI